MALAYPDVLVSSVLAVMEGVRTAVANASDVMRPTSGLRDRRRASHERRDVKERRRELLSRLDQVISNLSVLKFAPQDRTIEWTRTVGAESAAEALGSVKVGHGPVAAEVGANASETQTKAVTSSETIQSSKEEYLERTLTDFRAILVDAGHEVGGGFVFLDEFYRVNRGDQPLVLDTCTDSSRTPAFG